jgi:transposase
MGLPVQVKEAVLKRVLMGNRPHHEVALEFGIGRSTIGKWLREYKQTGNINLNSKEKRPKDWTATERLSALIETGTMTEEERASWCRKKGIFTHHLEQWKKDAISAMTPLKTNKEQNEKEKALQKEISVLKRDLLRKDKALAETAALLVLKKKVQEIWGEPEDD